MELITIQKYAAQNRQSIHNVIKKTMNGELKTLIKEENGKEITYIILDVATDHEAQETMVDSGIEIIDYKKAYEDLNKEYLILKTKYQKLLDSRG